LQGGPFLMGKAPCGQGRLAGFERLLWGGFSKRGCGVEWLGEKAGF